MTAADEPEHDVFDQPSRWRTEAVLSLDLQGEDRMAGASTGVAYPLALDPVVGALRVGPGDRVCDAGAGLGGAARWIATRTGADVVAVDPEPAAATGARRLFPQLATVVTADASALPFAAGRFDAVTLLGVVSLVADLQALLAEVVRVLRPEGRLGLTDLCLVSGSIDTDPPNTFRSMALLLDSIEQRGFRPIELAAGDADAPTRWSDAARRVDDEIERRHGESTAFRAWADDRSRLADAISGGALHVASVVAARSA